MQSEVEQELFNLTAQAKVIAKRYRELTGRPLGITGEIAEAEAVRLLGVELAPVRTAGYDVTRRSGRKEEKLQVKGRVLTSGRIAGRLGSIQFKHHWDGVLLVLMDLDFNAIGIYEATRGNVIEAITRPGSKARNERGSLSLQMFCRPTFSRRLWPKVQD